LCFREWESGDSGAQGIGEEKPFQRSFCLQISNYIVWANW